MASNIPFGDVSVFDLSYSRGKSPAKQQAAGSIHNYFFLKGLDALQEGGILAFITSQGVMNSDRNAPIREYLMENSRLISVVRLPNNLFSDYAGTEVGTDLIVLQKQSGKKPENKLGYRPSTKEYQYSDIISNYNNIFYCGDDCAEDIQQHLRPTPEAIPDNKACSADTLLRGISELATENKVFVSRQGKSYNFNINEKLNNLNIKSLLLTGQPKAGESHDLDYDNQLIANEKHDARLSYKKLMGAIFPALPQLAIKLSRWKTETVMPT